MSTILQFKKSVPHFQYQSVTRWLVATVLQSAKRELFSHWRVLLDSVALCIISSTLKNIKLGNPNKNEWKRFKKTCGYSFPHDFLIVKYS